MQNNSTEQLMLGGYVPQSTSNAVGNYQMFPKNQGIDPKVSKLLQSFGLGQNGQVGQPGGFGGFMGKMGGLEGLGSIGQGIGSAVQAYAALKGLGLAKDQLNFSKEAYGTNLANTTQSYNTTLEDRTNARFKTEGRGAGEVSDYLAKHSL